VPWVYLLRCADNTLYVGHADDLVAREEAHNDGVGARYTAKRLPVRIAYAEEHPSTESAIARERQVKGWTVNKKEALIAGDSMFLKRLSRRRRR
jgi:predicted GIY-YIG superfamily endonuclease